MFSQSAGRSISRLLQSASASFTFVYPLISLKRSYTDERGAISPDKLRKSATNHRRELQTHSDFANECDPIPIRKIRSGKPDPIGHLLTRIV
ncbi:hypothetical protein L596_001056 [Steinernema carpocapsae]|uniref:Uncharacterized protein n=1 Tax=Steinernema carpocapsae TaxID=34508 RepID=A0A4U8UMH3_STECR|nr:hypothetical protein L596_001056 [Steinernema carpocapsae]